MAKQIELKRHTDNEGDVLTHEAMRSADPDFVETESQELGEALRRVLERLDDGARALVVGHSPTSEAALLGLTGEVVGSLSKGEGVLLTADGEDFALQPLE